MKNLFLLVPLILVTLQGCVGKMVEAGQNDPYLVAARKFPEHCHKIKFEISHNLPVEGWPEEKVEECRTAWFGMRCEQYLNTKGEMRERLERDMSIVEIRECMASLEQ